MRHLPRDPYLAVVPAPAPPGSGERRAWVRYRCDRATIGRAFISNSFRSVPARVLDVSAAGVGLLLPESLPIGTRVNIEIDAAGVAPFELLAEIVNMTAQPGGDWRCGCELVWPLTDEELQLLLK